MAAFCAWLTEQGWTVTREVDFFDVLAERPGQRLVAEVKGRTASTGLDVDTMFGQLLRRMGDADDHTRYAAVVPINALSAVQRVSGHVRDLLRIDVFTVDDTGVVRRA
ncbi:hypothetical protein [Pseudokineococcus lusitanus]|uniref:hypothetical protein n=1 Tax=Pseudokineococcus lusitanus TaxID=763993 RepID=UPI000F494F61|nr:hypothetical protein [Pseudokineococcus lusitanus]